MSDQAVTSPATAASTARATAPTTSLAHPGIAGLLSLFEGPLADVRFPDVDRDALVDEAEAVRSAAAEVASATAALLAAQAALVAAESMLVTHDRALLSLGHKALAYARVFAEGQPALRADLEGLALPLSSGARSTSAERPAGEPRKRGRPRKVRPESSLFTPPSNDAGEESPALEAAH